MLFCTRMKKSIVFLVVAAFVAMTNVAQAEVHFKDIAFKEALTLAKKQHKIVMVDFYTTWCGWCKKLDRDVYATDDVGAYADSNIISLKLNAEAGEGAELARDCKLQGFPTIIFYDTDGAEIQRQVGYQGPSDFLATLQTVVQKNK